MINYFESSILFLFCIFLIENRANIELCSPRKLVRGRMTRVISFLLPDNTCNYRWHLFRCNFYSRSRSRIFHRSVEIFPTELLAAFLLVSQKEGFTKEWQEEVNFIPRHVSRFPSFLEIFSWYYLSVGKNSAYAIFPCIVIISLKFWNLWKVFLSAVKMAEFSFTKHFFLAKKGSMY